MPHRFTAIFFAAFALCAAAQEWNAPHTPKAKEHPLVKFYPQSSVYEYEEQAFDAAELIVGFDKANQEPKTANVEGRIVKYQAVHKPGTSSLEILRNYENALKKAGLVTLIAGKGKQFANIPVDPEDT